MGRDTSSACERIKSTKQGMRHEYPYYEMTPVVYLFESSVVFFYLSVYLSLLHPHSDPSAPQPRLSASGMVIPRSGMVVVPFPQRLKVATHVVDLKVRPVPLDSLVGQLGKLFEGEDAHVAMAHEILS